MAAAAAAIAQAAAGIGEVRVGTAATPGLRFQGGTNTGLFAPAADTLAISADGAERLRADSSSGVVTVDINEGGSSILSTKLSTDASEKTSTTGATAAVRSDTSIADHAEITIDIDGAGTDAKGLKVTLFYKWA